jgi:hypothetical protein
MPSIDSALGHIDEALKQVEGKSAKTLSASKGMKLPGEIDRVLADACETAVEIEEAAGVMPDREQCVASSKRFIQRARRAI